MNEKVQQAALRYAAKGWHVLPVGPDKQPLCSRGVHGATRNPTVIAAWPRGTTGVAIACGPSDLLVVDIDGPEALKFWRFIAGPNWKTATPAIVRTARGVHLYFKGAQTVPAKIASGVDLKSKGGYVIAPPSVHKTGHKYAWISEGEPTPFPDEINLIPPEPALSGGVATPLLVGGRNLGLTRQAGALRRAGLSGIELRTILAERNAALEKPLPDREVWAIAASAIRHFDEEVDAPLTDAGNATRLVCRYGDVLRYCPSWNKWLHWNGNRWEKDSGQYAARLLTEEIALDLRMVAGQQEDKKTQREIYNAAKRLGQRMGTEGALYAAQARALMKEDLLDKRPLLLNVANGTLDLGTGKVSPPNKKDLLTKSTPVRYEPNATCPRWEGFLEEILPDPEVRKFVQLAIGYSLTGLTTEQCLFFMYGTGANGKTTMVEALMYVLGDYGRKVSPDLLLPKHSRGASPEIVNLKGVRMAVASELELEQALPESRIKNLTGGDTVSGRGLYDKAYTTFLSTHKLWMFGNHKPAIRGTDEGIWRRMRLIPFEVRIPAEEQDPQLLDKLRDEAEGIFTWAVRGYQRWAGEGLPKPAALVTATETYRDEEDDVAQWLDAECAVCEGAWASAADLMKSWKQWVFRTYEGSKKGLSWRRTVPERLRSMGLEEKKRENKRGWFGIGLQKVSAVADDGKITLFV